MKRRLFLQLPLVLTIAPPLAAAPQPWSAKLLKGGFDGTQYWSGIAITLEHGWKTYWRVPGDGGIAPQFDVSGENLKSHRIDYPLPQRYVDEAGSTIGYKDTVVFPMALEPADPTKPMQIKFKSFIGVCDTVCIPAQFEAEITFDPAKSDATDISTIVEWQGRVPVKQVSGPVKKASARSAGDKFEMVLEVSEKLEALFVEGRPEHYFGQPVITATTAVFPVSGAKSVNELRKSPLRVTMQAPAGTAASLEQMVNVD